MILEMVLHARLASRAKYRQCCSVAEHTNRMVATRTLQSNTLRKPLQMLDDLDGVRCAVCHGLLNFAEPFANIRDCVLEQLLPLGLGPPLLV